MEQETFFKSLVENNRARLLRLCQTYAGSIHDREDLYQEIMVQLWRSLPVFKGNADINTWLYRVALNTAITQLRKKEKNSKVSFSEVINEPGDQVFHAEDTEAGQLSLLYSWIAGLNPMDKALVTLYLEDTSYRQMSEITGLSESNVGVRLNRVKQLFKQKAEKAYGT